ncbi:hypothetical protein [Spiroplasma diminutum]|uniref:Chitinase n=1 Tax=Spiroplasma diminutum CUAS-1 TaxID=1276221 RepID=S5M2K5_9MOLU|nr:hypothetical protein [Spiroplasma diminutum]AGR42322.1 hypothetical protein SDIMI_v3c06180 [Spiroplasma diminutum CUAS-1]
MKKLLAIIASTAFTVSITSTTVVSCTINLKDINSLRFNLDLGEMESVNQKEVIKQIAKINKITTNNPREIARLANLTLDTKSIKPKQPKISNETYADEKQEYSATINASKYSRIAKGSTEITFITTPEEIEKASNPIAQQERNLMGYWWNWGNSISIPNSETGEDYKKGLGWRDPKLEVVIKNSPYDIINISSLYTTNGENDIDGLNLADFTLDLDQENSPYDLANSKYLMDRKESTEKDNKKIIASFGGGSADRMIWKWKQKARLKNKLGSILNGFGLDGLDLAINGKTLYNRESQETISQSIKEIMIEYWLNNKDFHLSISAKNQWLLNNAISTNKPTVIPFIESLDGWFNDINYLAYNVYRPTYFVKAQDDITLTDLNGEEKSIKKGELFIPQKHEESPLYFYGNLRTLIDKKWNENSDYYYLGDKAVRISLGTKYSILRSAFEIKGENSNWTIALNALNEIKEDGKAISKNVLGFSYFGINIDQILSNEEPVKPTKFDHGTFLKDWMDKINKPNHNKTRF